MGKGLPPSSGRPSQSHLHQTLKDHGEPLLVQLVKRFAKGMAIPLNVVIQAACDYASLCCFKELPFRIVQDNHEYTEDINCKENARYMAAIQLPMMYVKVNCRDIKIRVEQPNSTEPIQ